LKAHVPTGLSTPIQRLVNSATTAHELRRPKVRDDLRQAADLLQVDVDGAKQGQQFDPWVVQRYRELLAKEKSLNALEPAPNEELLNRCLNAEEESRGLPPYQKEKAKNVAAN
jgi:hypothetical protein